LECLTERMNLESGDHREQVFWIVCRIMSTTALPPDCFRFGFDWLRSNVSPTIGPAAKYSIVDFATPLSDRGQWEGAELLSFIKYSDFSGKLC